MWAWRNRNAIRLSEATRRFPVARRHWDNALVHVALTLIALVSVVATVGAVARRYGLPAPLLLTVVGVVGSFVPFIPDIELTPDLVLIGLLPPLLYAAAIRTSLIDFRRNAKPIALLSVGLVIFTAIGVGLIAWWLLPIPLAAGLALGAVVAPPDAVAATSIARRVGMPRRLILILEGESLVNDATALVFLRAALAALAGSISMAQVGGEIAVAAAGGVAVGAAVAFVIGNIRKHTDDILTDTTVSLLSPFIAYLLAEEINASGALAVVIAGLMLGQAAPMMQSASARIFERTNWATVQFLLENSVFLLIGLQVHRILSDVGDSDLPASRIALVVAAVFAGVVLLRPLWVFPVIWASRTLPRAGQAHAPSWRILTVLSWAGMRGVVTLAAVFALPQDTPQREVLVLSALVVTGGTLLLQGTTLPWLVRGLHLPAPDPAADALQSAEVKQRAASAGLARLDELVTVDDPPEVLERLRRRGIERANVAWERLGGAAEAPSQAYARLRLEMLAAERQAVLDIRASGTMPDEVLTHVMNSLDVEESIIDTSESQDSSQREIELRTPMRRAGACEHLRDPGQPPVPRTPEGCEDCLAQGTQWVHLRLCMECGRVGCCDSSPERHATRHYEASDHPVIRSFEAGEAWLWCFADELLG
jgi:Na+/H+ antiporter